mgnify:CR=1 FL=1
MASFRKALDTIADLAARAKHDELLLEVEMLKANLDDDASDDEEAMETEPERHICTCSTAYKEAMKAFEVIRGRIDEVGDSDDEQAFEIIVQQFHDDLVA